MRAISKARIPAQMLPRNRLDKRRNPQLAPPVGQKQPKWLLLRDCDARAARNERLNLVARCRNQNAATWGKTAIRRRYRRCPFMPRENGSRSVLVIAFIDIGPILMPINVVK